MRTIKLISISEILEKLTFMKLKKIKTVFDSEDGSEVTQLYYFTSLDNVEKITISSYLWTTINVQLSDPEEAIEIFSDNINSDNKSLLREYTNNILSPSFSIKDGSIIVNSEIERWLNNLGVTEITYNDLNISGKYVFKDGIKIEKQEGCTTKRYKQVVEFTEEEIGTLISKVDTDLGNRLRILFNEEKLNYYL
jgi:hypothetical protein